MITLISFETLTIRGVIPYNRNRYFAIGSKTLYYTLFQDIVTLKVYAKLLKNLSINRGARMMTNFLKNKNCDLDLTWMSLLCL